MSYRYSARFFSIVAKPNPKQPFVFVWVFLGVVRGRVVANHTRPQKGQIRTHKHSYSDLPTPHPNKNQQITWFVAGLALDARRVAQGRYDGCPCFFVAVAPSPSPTTADSAAAADGASGGEGEGDEEERARRKGREAASVVSRVIDQCVHV